MGTISITGITSATSGNLIPAMIRKVTHYLLLRSCPVVLDIGAGQGAKTVYISEKIRKVGGFVIALELHRPFVLKIKAKIRRLNADVIWADAHYLPFRGDVADLTLLWNILMFVGNDNKVIYESFKAMNEFDDAGENRANVVDALFFIGRAIHRLAGAVEALGCHSLPSNNNH